MSKHFKVNKLAAALAMILASTSTLAQSSGRNVTAAPADQLGISQANEPEKLVLRNGIFDPQLERLSFSSVILDQHTDPAYAVVQFSDDGASLRKQLRERGHAIVGYLPNNAYVISTVGTSLDTISQMTSVRWVGNYQAGWKVDPALWPENAPSSGNTLEIEVDAFAGVAIDSILINLRKTLPAVDLSNLRDDEYTPRMRLRITANEIARAVEILAASNGVRWIAPYLAPQLHNDDSIGPMQNGSVSDTPIWDRDIIGTGQIVAVADSGLDRNESWFTRYDPGTGVVNLLTDADFPLPPAIGITYPTRKVFAYWVQPGASAYDNNATCPGGTSTGFHGSHVSGTVLGDRGVLVATPTEPGHDALGDDGMAPNAQLLFQDIGHDTTGCLSGLGNLQATMKQARNGGAHLSNNSWGSASGGAYSGSDVDVDKASWEMEDFLFVVSAGNNGSAANTTGSPGNSKNSLTVGALGHGNSTTIASFSSRGPTDDGRIKPDIVGPGSAIVSAAGNTNNDPTEQAGTSSSKSGTSMSAPTVTGSTALLRQYFEDGYYPRGVKTAADALNPNAALMKAALLNGSQILGTFPTNTFGWGRLNLENTLYFNSNVGGGGTGDTRRMRFWEREHDTGLITSQMQEYRLFSVAAAQPLRVTLTWMDPDANPGAAIALINNLDLEVVGPGGTNLYRGNVFTAGESTPNSGVADNRNNVEQVLISTPTAGEYILRVRGTAIPGNGRLFTERQGYALAASGAFGVPDTAGAAAPSAPTIASNNTAGIAVGFGGSSTQGFQLYRADGTCVTAKPKEFRLVASNAASPVVDDSSQGGYDYAYKVRAIGNDIEGNASTCITVLSNDSCTLPPSFNTAAIDRNFINAGCQVQLTWPAGASNCPSASALNYRVQRAGNAYMNGATQVADLPGASGFTDSAVTEGTPYFYRVLAQDSLGNQSAVSATLNATPTWFGGLTDGGFIDDVDDNTYMTMESAWRITNTRASTGSFSYHNAPDGANYSADTCSAITSPQFQVPAAGTTLRYDARFNVEVDWDGVIVEISTNNGTTWTDLPPNGGYPGSLNQTQNPPINACGYPASQGAFTGTSNGLFNTYSNSLNAYAGQSIRLRWRFTSDGGSEEEGFYLDNVRFAAPVVNRMFKGGFEESEINGSSGCFVP